MTDFIKRLDGLVDRFLEAVEISRSNRKITEKAAVQALESSGYTDLAEAYLNWLNDGDPDERDGSLSTRGNGDA